MGGGPAQLSAEHQPSRAAGHGTLQLVTLQLLLINMQVEGRKQGASSVTGFRREWSN